jgi:hypothetical protein
MLQFLPHLSNDLSILQGLLLGAIGFLVLEGEPARALVKLVVLADHGRVARKHGAVQAKCRKGGAAETAEQEARLAREGISAVAVEGADGVVEGCDDDGRVGEGGDGIGGSWSQVLVMVPRGKRGSNVQSRVEVSGMAPERTTTTRPSVSRAKPRDRAK